MLYLKIIEQLKTKLKIKVESILKFLILSTKFNFQVLHLVLVPHYIYFTHDQYGETASIFMEKLLLNGKVKAFIKQKNILCFS